MDATFHPAWLPGPPSPDNPRPPYPPGRSFESNLNTYKRLAIKLPDSQITKVSSVTTPTSQERCQAVSSDHISWLFTE